ncbi:hypothetical protein J8Z28_17605 [Pseudoalteromonas sp. SCSIO 43088]|uniref:hypothetical protein n=1 Tax=Pseudoalteromonas sp. SCSIO 43088 TaxID=2822846 RepID=UPI00202B5F3C|nr:hypothetical protein [Pseudoalteromonas sp. SCSIO 43088]URQ86308.1 hypothetical protein J8Z28_17605 [Pseudoalteromonas sp. SCSIO 43088]
MGINKKVNFLLEIPKGWDTKRNQVLLYEPKKNDSSKTQENQFLYKQKFAVREEMELFLSSMSDSDADIKLYENVKFIFTNNQVGLRTLVFDELVYMYRAWVVENYLDEDIFNKEFDSLFSIIGKDKIIKHFLVMSEEINLVISILNFKPSKFFKGSDHLNNLLHEIIESIKYDLVILLKRALLENWQNQT